MLTLRKHWYSANGGGKTLVRMTYLYPEGEIDLAPLEYEGAMTLNLIVLNRGILEHILSEIGQIEIVEIKPEISGTKWGAVNIAKGNDWDNLESLPTVLQQLTQQTEELLRVIFPKNVLDGEICFNDFSLRKYPAVETEGFAISPHRDDEKYINIIIVWVLKGDSSFYVCTDKEEANSKLIDANVGQPIMMRGADYADIKDRPYHYVRQTKTERITFTLRQTKEIK